MNFKAVFLFKLSFLLVISSLLFSASAKTRIYILAGQSNMMGKGKTFELPPAYKRQPQNVQFYYQGRQKPLARYSHFGPEVAFAHEISRAYPHDNHIIIKHVATGSSIQQWLPGGGLFNGLIRQRGFIKENDLKVDAVFWMQGESDARNRQNAIRYENSLKRFIVGLRTKLDSPHSPFIMGRINPEDKAFSMLETVQQAQKNMQHTLSNVTLVSTQGLGKIFDHVHYNAQGQIELGKRFARAYARRMTYAKK